MTLPPQSKPVGAFIPVGWLLDGLSTDGLGEALRELTFPAEGYGCYTTFDVREGAEKWDRNRRRDFWVRHLHSDPESIDEITDLGEGYTWREEGLEVEVCWYWDGDGTLAFVARGGGADKRLINQDCKKSYRWEVMP